MKEIIYKHYNKNGRYIILDYLLLQNELGEWKDAVLYKGLKSGLKFCRFESEFDLKFSAKKKNREK